MSTGAGKPTKKPAAKKQRPRPQAPAASGTTILVGDQIAAATSAAVALVPGARQARPIVAADVTGTPAEQLRAYEAAIESANETAQQTLSAARARYVIEAGTALREIRDRELYLVTHGSVETYVEQRWGMSRTRAYELIGAAPLMLALSEISDTPVIESQVRVLAPVLRSDRPALAGELLDRVRRDGGGKVTAKALKKAVKDAGFTTARTTAAPKPAAHTAGHRTPVERLAAAQERLSRVAGSVTRATVRAAADEHPAHTARLVADLTADVTAIAAALGLTVGGVEPTDG